MNTIERKMLSLGLIAFVTAALVFISPIVSADSRDNDRRVRMSDDQPKLNKITDVTKNSVVLSFKDKKFKNETVNVIVSIKNGALVERQFTATLDEKGKGNVTVKGLRSGVDYEFKVRLMRENSEKSTRNSSDRSARTL